MVAKFKVLLILLVIFSFFCTSAFSDVLSISVHSGFSQFPQDAFESCVFESIKTIKGQYVKPAPSTFPFSPKWAAEQGKAQLSDIVYHVELSEKDGKPNLYINQYTVALGRITARQEAMLDSGSLRPCDKAVFMLLDRIGNQPSLVDRAQADINQGRELAVTGQYDQAGAYYSRAAANYHHAGSVYREMGWYLEQGQKPDWAIEWYKTAIKMDDNEIESYLGIARIEHNRDWTEAAAGYLEQALDRTAKPPMIFAELGRYYQALGRDELAVDVFAKAYKLDQGDSDVLVRYIQMLTKTKSWAEAAKLQTAFIRANPDDADAVTVLLDLYMKAENYQAAIVMLESFLKTYPDASGWVIVLAQAYEGVQEFDQAEKQYLRLLELVPKNSHARLALAKMAYRKKDFAKAKELIRQVTKHTGIGPETLRMLSRIYEMEQDFPNAIDVQTRIIMLEDDVRDSDLLRLFALGRKSGNLAAVEAGINDLIPYKTRAQRRALIMALAESMIADGRKVEATQFLNRNMRKLDRHSPAYILLGRLMLEKKDFEQARTFFTRAVLFAPDDSLPMNIATIYHGLDRYEDAETFYSFALNRTPNNPKIQLQYLEATLIIGNLDSALWTIHELNQKELSPLYKLYFAFLQIMYAKIKGNDAYAQGTINFGLKLIEIHGTTKRLDFQDFVPLINEKFSGDEKLLLDDLLALFEGKTDLSAFRIKHPE